MDGFDTYGNFYTSKRNSYDLIRPLVSLSSVSITTYEPYHVLSSISSSDGYAFNGQMKVNEWAGNGNHLDFGARGYDTRTGRMPSPDPLTRSFPSQSPYVFAGNSPIAYIDYKGMFKMSKVSAEKYKGVFDYINDKNDGIIKILDNKDVLEILKEYGHISEAELRKVFSSGNGPEIVPTNFLCWDGSDQLADGFNCSAVFGYGENNVQIPTYFFDKYVTAQSDNERLAALFCILYGVIHEVSHFNIDQQFPFTTDAGIEKRNYYNTKINNEINDQYSAAMNRMRTYLARYRFALDHLTQFQLQNKAPTCLPGNITSNSGSKKRGDKDTKEHHNYGPHDKGKKGKDGRYH